MTKKNLTVGMVVKRADGQYRVVVDRRGELVVADLCGKFERFKYYNDDLTNKDDSAHDIIEVWNVPNHVTCSCFDVSTSNRTMLWQRVKVVTMAELEALLGSKVKIVNQ